MPAFVEIEYVGGPADGRREEIPAHNAMEPPEVWELIQGPDSEEINRLVEEQGPDEPLPIRSLVYRREASPRDDGPLWLYRYDPDASDPEEP